MRIPGVNLYRVATKVIGRQPIQYYMYKGRTLDKMRNYVTTYEEPITLLASVQAVLRNQYVELGLELQKNYVKIWVDKDIVDLDRDASGDYLCLVGKRIKWKMKRHGLTKMVGRLALPWK
ncbi:hypothetical protein WFH_00029 [Escherichia phage vB_EcoM_WFH]|uniref:Uncharacterized protein n=1 Tax=Escherichia phage vB_EcoM_WFH TaxID=2508192 RepID=A0A482MTD4_9CAUD|nr:head protein [Escherichia phage vB_EcoM_WFH]QBQ77317.1 hypothetical protein WFH_00029 [Escherichia phage vB_EcoM_WFH]